MFLFNSNRDDAPVNINAAFDAVIFSTYLVASGLDPMCPIIRNTLNMYALSQFSNYFAKVN